MPREYKRKTKPIDKQQLAKAIEAVKNGESVFKASKQYGIAYETLRSNCKPSKGTKHGSRISQTKLSAALASIEGGKAIRAAAAEVGIGYGTLQTYLNRKLIDEGKEKEDSHLVSSVVQLSFFLVSVFSAS